MRLACGLAVDHQFILLCQPPFYNLYNIALTVSRGQLPLDQVKSPTV
jgi:hypothetical protein